MIVFVLWSPCVRINLLDTFLNGNVRQCATRMFVAVCMAVLSVRNFELVDNRSTLLLIFNPSIYSIRILRMGKWFVLHLLTLFSSISMDTFMF